MASVIDTHENNRFSHQRALFTVGRISRIVYRFLESRIKKQLYSFILSTAETGVILNNRLHGGAFILPHDITDIKESRL